ncbi:MAG: response regulator, partial [Planctomycetaceae bacterium]|nr:response regulator [Planctomycetaceae bacterium]
MTKSATILVVEDNPITRKMIRVALESHDYSAVEAADGRSTIAAVEALRPDLILMDLNLPDMDGLKLVQVLRSMPQAASAPIFAITGSGAKIDRARELPVGFTEVLLKPVSPADLLKLVESHLGKSGAETRRLRRDKRILIVNEQPLELRLLRLNFEKRGYGIIPAEDGRRGLSQALQCLPDAVVSEVLPQHLDGFRLCREIRKDRRLSRIPVVLLSRIPVADADRRLARTVGAVLVELRSTIESEVVMALEEALRNPMATGTVGGEEEPALEDLVDHLHRQVISKKEDNRRLDRRRTLLEAELAVLGGLSDVLQKDSSIPATLSEVFHRCLDAAGVSQGAAYLIGPGGSLTLEVDYGASGALENQSLFREVLERGESLVDVLRPVGDGKGGVRIHRLIAPILLGQERLGVIVLASTHEELGDDWMAFGKAIGSQVGQAIGLTRALSSLSVSEAHHRLLVEGLDAIVCEADPMTLRFSFVSRQAERMLGHPESEWTSRLADWPAHVHFEDRAEVLEALHHAASHPGSHQFEYRTVSAGGAVVWLRVFLHSGPEEGCGPKRLRGVMVNVTERRQGEEKRIRDLTLLNGMNELLAACSTMDEAYDVVGRTTRELFPRESGATFVVHTPGGTVEAKSAWGSHSILPENGKFAPDDCWALKRGKVHRSDDVLSGIVCRHLPSP